MTDFISWFQENWIENVATIAGLLYVINAVRESLWAWLFGAIGASLHVIVFFSSGFYADSAMSSYYFFISVYGWYNWKFGKHEKNRKTIPIRRTGMKEWLKLIAATCVLFCIISQVLVHFTDSEISYWDAFTTATGITGTYMVTQKQIENWIIWIIVDTVCACLYFYKGLNPTAFLYGVYTIVAIIGYVDWHRKLKTETMLKAA